MWIYFVYVFKFKTVIIIVPSAQGRKCREDEHSSQGHAENNAVTYWIAIFIQDVPMLNWTNDFLKK